LNVTDNFENIKQVIEKLKAAGVFVSIFIDPDLEQIEEAKNAGAQQIELCTAEYAEMTLSARAAHGVGAEKAEAEIKRIKNASQRAQSLGLIVAAGHGLTYRNIGALAAISEITEFNIGHNIISRSVFVGLNQAVKEMIAAISQK
jgi:pyridoxine 5-phosphate synthase